MRRGSRLSQSTLGESRILLHPHVFLYSLQMWVPDACRLTPTLAQRLNAVLQVDLCLFILYWMVFVFSLEKLHHRYCRPKSAAFWFLVLGPLQSQALSNRFHCPNFTLFPRINLCVMLSVHLRHRGTSFKSFKLAFTVVAWNKFCALKTIALMPSSCYGTGKQWGISLRKCHFMVLFCSPRLENERTRGKIEWPGSFVNRAAQCITKLLLKWLREAI